MNINNIYKILSFLEKKDFDSINDLSLNTGLSKTVVHRTLKYCSNNMLLFETTIKNNKNHYTITDKGKEVIDIIYNLNQLIEM